MEELAAPPSDASLERLSGELILLKHWISFGQGSLIADQDSLVQVWKEKNIWHRISLNN